MIFPTISVNSELFINGKSKKEVSAIYDFLNLKHIRMHPVAKSLPKPISPIQKDGNNTYLFSCGSYGNNFTIYTKPEFIINYIRIISIFIDIFSIGLTFYIPDIPCGENDKDFNYVTKYPHILIPIEITYLNNDFKKATLFYSHIYFTLQARLNPITEEYYKFCLKTIYQNFFIYKKSSQLFLSIDEFRMINFGTPHTNELFKVRSAMNDSLLDRLKNSMKLNHISYFDDQIIKDFTNLNYILNGLIKFTYEDKEYKIYLANHYSDSFHIICEIDEQFIDFNNMCIQQYFIINALLYAMYNKGIVEYDGSKTVNNSDIFGKIFILRLTNNVALEIFFTGSTYEYIFMTEIELK